MATGTADGQSSLLEFLSANTTLALSQRVCPKSVPERRTHARFAPVGQVTVRLDVMGGIWSARVKDICAGSALLQLDHEIADRIEDGQPASLWLESRWGTPIRLDGSLSTLASPARTAPDEPVAASFTCAAQALEAAHSTSR